MACALPHSCSLPRPRRARDRQLVACPCGKVYVCCLVGGYGGSFWTWELTELRTDGGES